MAGLRRRYGPQRSVGSGSYNPKSKIRGNFPNPFRQKTALGGPLKVPGVNISVIPHVRFVTFDRNVIKTNWKAINRNPLQRAGNLIRMRARGSIRAVRKTAPPSPPGTPPRSRFGGTSKRAKRGGGPAPFKMIYNLPTSFDTGQIIGMVGFSSVHIGGELPPPGLHELGGRARRATLNPKWWSASDRMRKHIPRFIMKTVRYPKRPFMRPALAALISEGRLPGLWRNSVTRYSHRGLAA